MYIYRLLKKAQNLEALGSDMMHYFWYQYLTCVHPVLGRCMENIIVSPKLGASFILEGIMYILSKKYRKLIIQKARLKRLSKIFLTLSWHHCPLYWRGVRARSVIKSVHCARCCQFISSVFCDFFQWIRMSNKEFVSNFALQMEFHVQNCWKCYRRLTVHRLYQKHVHMSGTVHSKTVEMWWKICLGLVSHQRLQLKLTLLNWRKWWLKIVIYV